MTNKITDQSNDAKYFTITPRLVWALSRTPYDLALWHTIKGIAGDGGECIIGTTDLATLAMMSMGKVSDCRAYLLKMGLLEGDLRRDPGYSQKVWHLSIPNLWRRNLSWAEEHLTIASRVEWKKSFHQVKGEVLRQNVSSGESTVTPGESTIIPGETKKIHIEDPIEDPLPERQPAPVTDLSEPELVPFGDDDWPEDERKGPKLPKWRRPELPIHHEVLAACRAAKFSTTSKMKRRLTSLARGIKTGDALGDEVYAVCLGKLNGADILDPQQVPIPASWIPYRLEQARRHYWGVDGTIDALFNVEALATHCRYRLREMGAKAPPAPKTYKKAYFPERGQDLTMKE